MDFFSFNSILKKDLLPLKTNIFLGEYFLIYKITINLTKNQCYYFFSYIDYKGK